MDEERGFNPAPADHEHPTPPASEGAGDEAERESQGEDPISPQRGFHDIEEAAGEKDE